MHVRTTGLAAGLALDELYDSVSVDLRSYLSYVIGGKIEEIIYRAFAQEADDFG